MRPAIITLALFAAALVVWRFLWRFWLHVVMGWGAYHVTIEGLDPAMLFLWFLLAVLWAAVGILLVTFGRPPRPLIFAAAVGACFGLVQLYRGKHYFAEDAGVWTYFWSYGLYAVAPLASLLGAACAVRWKRQNAV